ncbi:hypothetical protein [Halorubrum halophilum]|uniref:hypothetical protein n=1 Tax=Halorubrum halophilum TaxID=413816 RepID=UPI0012AB3B4C|nr:hypothetical protein [Halorubrum halophilum]
MNPTYFTDWKNVSRDPEPTSPKNYPFNPIPLVERSDGNDIEWISHGRYGCVVNTGKAGKRSWTYTPGVNASRWLLRESRGYWNRSRNLPNYPIDKRMMAINDDTRIHKWQNKKLVRSQYRWRDCSVLCSRLELTPYQKLRVHYLYEESRAENLGKRGEFIIFMLAILVCREDGRQFTRHPSSKSEDPIFEEVATEYSFKNKMIRRWIKKLPAMPWTEGVLGNRPKRDTPKRIQN